MKKEEVKEFVEKNNDTIIFAIGGAIGSAIVAGISFKFGYIVGEHAAKMKLHKWVEENGNHVMYSIMRAGSNAQKIAISKKFPEIFDKIYENGPLTIRFPGWKLDWKLKQIDLDWDAIIKEGAEMVSG